MMKEKRKSHGVQLLIRAVVTDPDGKVISDTGEKPSKSFVIQFLEFVGALFDGGPASPTLGTATTGSEEHLWREDSSALGFMRANAAVNVSSYGIVVGTGDTGEANTDYKLETQLTHGVGVGNISHGQCSVGITAVVGANVDMEIVRVFTNNTGLLITVKEAGLVMYNTIDIGPKFLLIRDVLAPPIDIPDKCSLTVYYTIRTTV